MDYSPGWVVDISMHRYCCDNHQICDLRMNEYGKLQFYLSWTSNDDLEQ